MRVPTSIFPTIVFTVVFPRVRKLIIIDFKFDRNTISFGIDLTFGAGSLIPVKIICPSNYPKGEHLSDMLMKIGSYKIKIADKMEEVSKSNVGDVMDYVFQKLENRREALLEEDEEDDYLDE